MRLRIILAVAVLLGMIGTRVSAQICTPVTLSNVSDKLVPSGSGLTFVVGPDPITATVNVRSGFNGCTQSWTGELTASVTIKNNTTNTVVYGPTTPQVIEGQRSGCLASCTFTGTNPANDVPGPTIVLVSGDSYTLTETLVGVAFNIGQSQPYNTSVSFIANSDGFNYPNGSHPQSPWAVREGTFQFGGNDQLIFWSGTSGILLYNVSISNDQCTTITLGTGLPSLTGAWAGYVRLAADASSMYYGEFYSNGTSSSSAFYLGKLVNGTYTTLGGLLHSFGTGDSLTTCARGSDISAFYNSVNNPTLSKQVIDVIDNDITSGYPGIGVNGANGVSLEGFQALTNIH